MKQRIYIADDEANIRFIISSFLKNEGYEVFDFENGDLLLEAFMKQPCDMVILDLMMSGSDGLTICMKLRERHNVPIIIVSARDSELDRITGITMGSDDYLVKPFSPVELVARVKALFRRIHLDQKPLCKELLTYGDLTMNIAQRSATIKNQTLELTPTEFALLSYLLQHSDKAVSRSELLKNVWNFDFEADTRATDDLMKRLRKKLSTSEVLIESVWGFGFKLNKRSIHEDPQ
ncbi:MAG: response regulator with CheY-like receiver domain and winged-helix DNA-binding domain [Erysipelotrichaceae bacterium]|nr:MAG: response regulator with CheY-like receiver domain and winged-helix DNA-binding [Erysipelotrichaceae bacterium]TXT19021.1 MAG: response regulator with CheY-like receiver domain and winged-helix DNA-binding domain [Erysipelotrichaceae bacterium]